MSNLVWAMISASCFLLFLIWFGWSGWKMSKDMKGMTDYEKKRYMQGKTI